MSSASEVGGETKVAVGWEGAEAESTSFVTTASVCNAGGDAYDV